MFVSLLVINEVQQYLKCLKLQQYWATLLQIPVSPLFKILPFIAVKLGLGDGIVEDLIGFVRDSKFGSLNCVLDPLNTIIQTGHAFCDVLQKETFKAENIFQSAVCVPTDTSA